MSKNSAPRIDVGESDKGHVFIHSFAGTPVGGRPTRFRYEVRVGNHTIVTKATLPEAEAVAYALVGTPAPEPEKATPELETFAELGPEGLKAGTRKAKKAK